MWGLLIFENFENSTDVYFPSKKENFQTFEKFIVYQQLASEYLYNFLFSEYL